MQHSSWNTLGYKATEFRACSPKNEKKRAKNVWLHDGRSSTDQWSKLSLGEDWKLTLLRKRRSRDWTQGTPLPSTKELLRNSVLYRVKKWISKNLYSSNWDRGLLYFLSWGEETISSTGRPTSRTSVLHRFHNVRDSLWPSLYFASLLFKLWVEKEEPGFLIYSLKLRSRQYFH